MTDRPHCLSVDACVSKGPRHCRRCANTASACNPETRAARAASMRARFDDPEFHARHVALTREGTARAMQNPAFVESKRRSGREFGSKNIVHTRGPESRARAGRAISAAKLTWCPEEFRPQYRALRKKGIEPNEARAVIEAMIPGEGARIVARIAAEQRAKHEREKAQAY